MLAYQAIPDCNQIILRNILYKEEILRLLYNPCPALHTQTYADYSSVDVEYMVKIKSRIATVSKIHHAW